VVVKVPLAYCGVNAVVFLALFATSKANKYMFAFLNGINLDRESLNRNQTKFM